MADIGMAIGAKQWRKDYQVPQKAKVPLSLLKLQGQEANEVEIESLTQLFEWIIRQIDALFGQFEIDLEVEDLDPNAEGNQQVQFKLRNVAEALAEIMQVSLNASINSDLIVNLLSRALVESGQMKKMEVGNSYYLQAIAQYLGFDLREKQVDVPFTFTPNADSLSKLVKEQKCPVDVVEFNGKDNLQVVLLNLLQSTAIARSSRWKKLTDASSATAIAAQLSKIVGDYGNNADAVDGGDSVDEFKDFLREVEQGFVGTQDNTQSIYGENNPEITVIDTPQQEGN